VNKKGGRYEHRKVDYGPITRAGVQEVENGGVIIFGGIGEKKKGKYLRQ